MARNEGLLAAMLEVLDRERAKREKRGRPALDIDLVAHPTPCSPAPSPPRFWAPTITTNSKSMAGCRRPEPQSPLNRSSD